MKSKYGVTGRQRLIIQVVNEFPGISAGDLAKVLHLDPSTLTGVLQQMSQRGLLLLQPDMRDRRRLRIQLTTKGRRMSHMAVGAIEAAVSRTLVTRLACEAEGHARGAGAPRRQFGSARRRGNAHRSGHICLRSKKPYTVDNFVRTAFVQVARRAKRVRILQYVRAAASYFR